LKRSTVFGLVVLLCVFTHAASADSGRFGLGVMLGEPSGVSAKLWLMESSAVDAVVAWSFVNNPSVTVHADYLFHFFNVITVREGRLPLYLGIGGAVSISDDPDFGARIPVGLSYLFADAPLDIFLEAAPIFLFYPATTFDFSGGIGIRFYFPARKRS
jgi:hypothetical protein